MTNTQTIPNASKHDVVTFDVIINGTVIDPAVEVLSISIIHEVNRIPTARLVIRDGDASERNFPESETDSFLPGNKIHLKVGLDRKNKTAFKGIITKQRIKVTESGSARMIIECKDEAVKMTVGRKNKYFEEQKDSEIIEEIIGEYGSLTPDIESTSVKHMEMVQYHCSDWDFILSRAEVNGHIVLVKNSEITTQKPDTNSTPALNVAYGMSLIEVEAEMEARTQWSQVEAKSWDYAGQTLFSAVASNADVKELGNVSGKKLSEVINLSNFEIRTSGHAEEAELQAWAEATMLKSRLAKICGRAKFNGFSDIEPGQMLEMGGLGARFNGMAFISAVRQEVVEGTWYTHVQLGLEPDWFAKKEAIIDLPAAGLLPGINGLQIGKVVQLQDDPNGDNRILVRLPIIDPAAQGVWARVCTLDAGSNRGSFFLPEIDDEVIVGFLNDDPRDAVVLGMLNSSAKPAPDSAQDDNHVKGFTTRSEMHLKFNDDTKTITIDTPAGNSIELDEAGSAITIKDQNNNEIKLSPSGIDMTSPAAINIKAGTTLALSAGTSLSIGAPQISAQADAAIDLSGATAKLAGSGMTTISGGMVKIN